LAFVGLHANETSLERVASSVQWDRLRSLCRNDTGSVSPRATAATVVVAVTAQEAAAVIDRNQTRTPALFAN
jgi:hypothetical protein